MDRYQYPQFGVNALNLTMTIDFQVLFVDRDNLEILLEDINHQKKILKEQGITIDGRHYSVEFLGKNQS